MPRRTDLQPVPSHVNGYPVVASKPATLADSEICDIILCRRDVNDYVTWCYNRQCPGASSGHYDMSLASAAADFTNRGASLPGRTGPEATDEEYTALGFAFRGTF